MDLWYLCVLSCYDSHCNVSHSYLFQPPTQWEDSIQKGSNLQIYFSFFKVLHDLIVALKIVTPNSETAPSLEENKENIRQMASADAVDNGNSDSKTTSTTEVPMEVEGSGETNTNESVTNSSDSFTDLEFRSYEKKS